MITATWEVQPIPTDELPDAARAYFVQQATGFNLLLASDVLWVAGQDGEDTKTYAAVNSQISRQDGTTEKRIYLTDVDGEEKAVGTGVVRFVTPSEDPFFKNKPFAFRLETPESASKQEYDLRRLIAMNALTNHLFGHKLHSDIWLAPPVAPLWVTLVRQEVAVHYFEEKDDRFRFK